MALLPSIVFNSLYLSHQTHTHTHTHMYTHTHTRTLIHTHTHTFVQEYNHQIDRNYGCKVLSMTPRTSPDDEELQKLSADFMLASMKCYVNALKKRSKVLDPFIFIISRKRTILHYIILCYDSMSLSLSLSHSLSHSLSLTLSFYLSLSFFLSLSLSFLALSCEETDYRGI